MDSHLIITGQYVQIQMQKAGVGERIGAYLIDIVILTFYTYFVFFLIEGIGYLGDFSNDIEYSDLLLTILFLPAMLYQVLFETLLNGRTPGKLLVGLKVSKLDGTSPGFFSYFLRWVLLPIDISVFGVGLIFMALTKNTQRLGDLAAGTIVVRKKRKISFNLDKLYFEIDDQHKLVYKEAGNLSDGQVALITRVLLDYNKRDQDFVNILAIKVRDILKIKPDQNDQAFLTTVVKDYHILRV